MLVLIFVVLYSYLILAMNKTHMKTGRLHFYILALSGVIVLTLFAVFGVLASPQQAGAVTTDDYCSQYTTNSKLNACKDGIRGTDCNDYAITFDEEVANVCRSAAQAKASGQITDNPTFNPTPGDTNSTDAETYRNNILSACSPYQNDALAAQWCMYGGGTDGKPKTISDCLTNEQLQGITRYQSACIDGASAGQSYNAAKKGDAEGAASSLQNANSIQDVLDQSQSMQQYIDLLHQFGPNADTDLSQMADNNYGSYVNGAGKQQQVKVHPGAGCTTNPAAGATNNTGGLLGDTGSILGGSPNQDLFGDQGGLGGQNGLNNQNNQGNTVIINNGGTVNVNNGTDALGAGGGCPVIVFINGGGWHTNDGTSDKFAPGSPDDKGNPAPAGGGPNQRGYTVIEVTYRLGSSGIYYMFEDVMRGIQHVRNNAGMYGIDPNRMAIMGDSAGGSLALRAGSSGKSGAKVQVGWSAPSNAYTALFKSYKSFMIGMDHSTCIPTDLAGLTNFTDLLNGGSGQVAEYGQGLSSNDFSSLGIGQHGSGAPTGFSQPSGDAISTITQVLMAGQYAVQTSQNVEAISSQLQSGNPMAMSGSVINMSAQKLIECTDNLNAASPALFASPGSPAGYLAGFDNDDLIDPSQLYEMRDKLQGLGVKAEALVLQGNPNAQAQPLGATENHLGYDSRFVCPTLNFIESVIDPAKAADAIDCTTGKRPSENVPPPPAPDNGGGGNGSSGSSGSSNNSGGSGSSSTSKGPLCGETPETKGYKWTGSACVPQGVESIVNGCPTYRSGGVTAYAGPNGSDGGCSGGPPAPAPAPPPSSSNGFKPGTQGCANGGIIGFDPMSGKYTCK